MNSLKFFQTPQAESSVTSILSKFEQLKETNLELKEREAALSFDQLNEMLSPEEKNIIEIILSIDPKQLGFRGSFLGIVAVPADLVSLKDQKVTVDGKTNVLATVLVPKNVYEGYMELKNALKKELGKDLLIDSGYRSSAFQVITLLHYLKMYNFDLEQTAKRVAFPGYSEHGFPVKQAIDFINSEGKPTDDSPFDFEDTDEYRWLVENAEKFGFVLSYPKDNPDGIMYEPWHWRFEG